MRVITAQYEGTSLAVHPMMKRALADTRQIPRGFSATCSSCAFLYADVQAIGSCASLRNSNEHDFNISVEKVIAPIQELHYMTCAFKLF